MAEDRRYQDGDGKSTDPPMTDYEGEILGELRQVFSYPYAVYKIPQRPNESHLMWNADFWMEKKHVGQKRSVILVIKALAPDTTSKNLDARLREAYAVMVLNWQEAQHGGVLVPKRRAVIVPDKPMEELRREEHSLRYTYAFDMFDCDLVPRKYIVELELNRDQEDRDKRPLDGRRR